DFVNAWRGLKVKLEELPARINCPIAQHRIANDAQPYIVYVPIAADQVEACRGGELDADVLSSPRLIASYGRHLRVKIDEMRVRREQSFAVRNDGRTNRDLVAGVVAVIKADLQGRAI